jgi:hypothetical protein
MSLSSIYGGLRFLPQGKQAEPLCHPCRGYLSSTHLPTAFAVGYVVSSLRDSRPKDLSSAYIFEDLGVETGDL